jgi:hypothetical protein
MKKPYLITAAAIAVSSPVFAQQVPNGAADIPVSSKDRFYTSDQFSNTVSVINPATNSLLGVIKLGDLTPANLSPLYKGELLVHGMGFSPDRKTLAVVSIGSNSVTSSIPRPIRSSTRPTSAARLTKLSSARMAAKSGSAFAARITCPSSTAAHSRKPGGSPFPTDRA